MTSVLLASGLVGVGVFLALAGLTDRTRRRPRIAPAGLAVLVPLGLAVGIGWAGFTDHVLNDPDAEHFGPRTHQLETLVYSCPAPFADQPLKLGWGLEEPVCIDDARLRRRIASCLLVGAAVSSLALCARATSTRRRRSSPVATG